MMERSSKIGTLEDNAEIREKLAKIRTILEEAEEQSYSDKQFKYVSPCLIKLAEMFEECEQYEDHIEMGGEPVLVDRVFKINRVIPKWILDYSGIKYCMLGGVFMELPCFLLPADRVNKCWRSSNTRGKQIVIVNPENFGLPSGSVANYATIKYLNPSCYVCLPRVNNEVVKDWIITAKHLDYVRVK